MSNPNRSTRKLRLQAAAFLLIILPSFGLYIAVTSGVTPMIWLQMVFIAAAMILAAAIS